MRIFHNKSTLLAGVALSGFVLLQAGEAAACQCVRELERIRGEIDTGNQTLARINNDTLPAHAGTIVDALNTAIQQQIQADTQRQDAQDAEDHDQEILSAGIDAADDRRLQASACVTGGASEQIGAIQANSNTMAGQISGAIAQRRAAAAQAAAAAGGAGGSGSSGGGRLADPGPGGAGSGGFVAQSNLLLAQDEEFKASAAAIHGGIDGGTALISDSHMTIEDPAEIEAVTMQFVPLYTNPFPPREVLPDDQSPAGRAIRAQQLSYQARMSISERVVTDMVSQRVPNAGGTDFATLLEEMLGDNAQYADIPAQISEEHFLEILAQFRMENPDYWVAFAAMSEEELAREHATVDINMLFFLAEMQKMQRQQTLLLAGIHSMLAEETHAELRNSGLNSSSN